MNGLLRILPVLIVAAVAVRLWRRMRRRGGSSPAAGRSRNGPRRILWRVLAPRFGDVGLVAAREIRERVRGRFFRIVTVVILLGVGAAIVIPVVGRGTPRPQEIGVVGARSASLEAVVAATAASIGAAVHLVPESDLASARADLASGRVGLAIVDARQLVVDRAIQPTDTSVTAQLVRALSKTLGLDAALRAEGLSPAQAMKVARAGPLPVTSLQPGPKKGTTRVTSLIGLIVAFVMLTQYNTWTLLGVMEEKSSRVVEVLLAAVRPVQLLAGKVLGIGVVAFAQAGVIVAFALGLAKAVGSDLLQGTAPLELVSTLVWLVLGYAFYSWVYAAAGSMAERQDQVQSLAFPLSLPILLGYVMGFAVLGAGSASTFADVLAYLPPTAPFIMPVLVGLGAVTWWQFAAAVVLSLLCTVGVARLAAGIYRRAVLRTGQRVRLREVASRAAG